MTEDVIEMEKATVAGANVVGGVGGVANPSAGNMGTFAGGSAPGIADPITGTTGGGVLGTEQSRRFIDYIWDNMVWSKEGRRVTMRANTAELNKMGVGERVIKAAKQAENTAVNANVKFTKVELTTRKVRLDWEVSSEALEDNIEGDALEDHIARSMTQQFAKDLEDLAINADASVADGFHDIFGYDGFLEQYKAAVTEVTWDDEAVTDPYITVEVFQNLVKALPRKFRGVKSNLRFYASTDAFVEAINHLGSAGNLTAENIITRVVDGSAPQTIGAPQRYSVLGVPLIEVPLLGDPGAKVVVCTFPENNIWGFQRDITVHSEFVPRKDTTEYTVYARFGVAIEEAAAASVAIPDANAIAG
jgi:HK97 family phage major capsid protein